VIHEDGQIDILRFPLRTARWAALWDGAGRRFVVGHWPPDSTSETGSFQTVLAGEGGTGVLSSNLLPGRLSRTTSMRVCRADGTNLAVRYHLPLGLGRFFMNPVPRRQTRSGRGYQKGPGGSGWIGRNAGWMLSAVIQPAGAGARGGAGCVPRA